MKFWEKPFGMDKPSTTVGEVHVIKERCKGCGFCIEYCPNKMLEFSEEYNEKGYHPPVVKNRDLCSGCGLCEIICPDFAIYVTERVGSSSVGEEEKVV